MRQLIRNIAIFDGTGAAPFPGAVIVEGDRIAAFLHDEAAIAAVEADSVIDGLGATLMPGMVDSHTHLTWGSSVEKIYHQFILPPEELKVAAWRNARVLLDHGFTSLYSAGALGDQIEPELARASSPRPSSAALKAKRVSKPVTCSTVVAPKPCAPSSPTARRRGCSP